MVSERFFASRPDRTLDLRKSDGGTEGTGGKDRIASIMGGSPLISSPVVERYPLW